jgi:hypothetical protein
MDIRRSADVALVRKFYSESISLVSFLMAEGGADRFVRFCRSLRDGKSLEDGLRFAYPDSVSSIEALEAKWEKHLRGDGR